MKHLTINEVLPEDYRFIQKPDMNFSPERNYQVISEVIQDGYNLARTMRAAQKKDTEERVDILSTYARHALDGGEKTLEQFMGREWMKKIYGEKILEKLRIADSIRRLNRTNGNTKFENFYLS